MDKNQNNMNRIYEALNLLYLATKDQQKEYFKTFNEINRLSFLKEFSTIKLCAARQTGHTTAICKFLSKRKKENWLILADMDHLLCGVRRMIIHGKEDNDNRDRCDWESVEFKEGGSVKTGSIHDGGRRYKYNKYRGLQLDGIIIECASFLSASKVEGIYDDLGPCLYYTNGVIIFME